MRARTVWLRLLSLSLLSLSLPSARALQCVRLQTTGKADSVAAAAAALGALSYNGQRCTAIKLLMVHAAG